MRNSLFSLICGICTICGSTVFAAHEYGKTVYYGDVTTGTWPTLNASSNAVYTAAGTYTNGLYTNYYRLSYTNLLGRGPLAPVTIAFTGNPSTIPGTNTVTFIYTNILGHGVWVPTVIGYTGDTNTIVGTNTVSLTWQIQGGAAGYIIERSLDAGTSWTNWVATGPTSTNFYDYGTNTWTASTFTNLYSPIPPPSVPQGGSGTGGISMAELEANRSYWGRNEAGEITLKDATNRLNDVYWTTNSAGEVIIK